MTTDNVHPYCVTRQRYWHEDGFHCLETACTDPPVTALRLFEPVWEEMPGQTWIETP